MTGLIPAHAGNTRVYSGGQPAGWFIPAHAGNTLVSLSQLHRKAAHPRSRREHGAREGGEGALPGSSPLTRGTHRPTSIVLA